MTISRSSSLHQLIDATFFFAAVFSRDGWLLEANRTVLASSDEPADHLYGKHAGDIRALAHSTQSRAQVLAMLERAAEGHTVRDELLVRLAGGRMAIVETLAMPLHDAAGQIQQIGAVGVEITAQKDADAALRRVNRHLRMLSHCNQALMRIAREDELLQEICRIIVDEGDYRFAWIGTKGADPGFAVRPVASAGVDPAYLDALRITWDDTPTGRGPTGRAIREGSAQICRDIGTDPPFEPWRHRALELGYVCSAAFPITVEDARIGSLNIYSALPGAFDPAEIELLGELTEDLAYGLRAMRTLERHRRAQSQLQMFRRLLDRAGDMIYVVDATTGRLLDANEAVSRQLGYSRSELIGMHLTDFSVVAAELPWAERLAQIASAGSLVFETLYRRRNGTTFPVEVSLSHTVQDDTRYLVSVIRDQSRQKQQQALIEHMGRVLRMQSAINSAVLRIKDRDELLQEACRLATQVGGYDRAVVSLAAEDGRSAHPRFRAGTGVDFPEPDDLPISDGTTPDTSLTSQALRTGSIAVCSDLAHSSSPVAMRQRLIELGFRTVVALPFIVEGRRIGAMTLTSRDPALISDSEMLLLEEMTANLSYALRTQAQATTVEFLASYDPLTGLANRSLFCKRVDAALARATAPVMNPAVAAFDILHLSNINDTFGRAFGDRLLQQVAERLRRGVVRDEGIGYVGAGTFVLVEPELFTSEASVSELLESTVFREAFSIDGREIRVSCRSGVARAPADGTDAATLLQNAEAALKRARDIGEQHLSYRLEMHSEVAEKLELESRLREAIDKQQFVLHYQPQVNITTGRIESVEALLRWDDPRRGMVSPAQFLPVLESSGLIVAVGEWVLRRAVEDCVHWAAQGLGPIRVGVNVSPLQLRRMGFVELVLSIAGHVPHELPGFGIDLEITETALLQDLDGTSDKLRRLRAAGIRIALDDFGTGYSSLGLLSHLPVDMLKIDRSFVAGLPKTPESITLAGTIISLVSAFGLLTVGEGVETAEQLALLSGMNCDLSQGYLHSRPVPAQALEALLRSGILPGSTPENPG